ncbi:unnamed protein product [Adineta ricciae]|uniref:Uncharacterized protein n=1 Tax=Adineta ricciae TaxID=249248 RepID=A0A813SQT3_ADIRI|nr:unnamed protein product [Adineta ricciae]
MTCVTVPMASLSSRSDDRFQQLKIFASPVLTTNSTCAKFDIRSAYNMYLQPVNALIGDICSIVQLQPMLMIYLNDYVDENHASPAAYLFFLKLLTFLHYPMVTFHFFHPFHPGLFPNLRFFQLAPTYREEARALISLMERYDWNTFSLIIDPQLPGEEDLIAEFEEHNSEQRNCRKNLCNRNLRKDQKKLTILSIVHVRSTDPGHVRQQLSLMNPETRVIIMHTTSTLASIIVKQANNISLTGPEYMWIMSSIVLSTYSSGNEPRLSPYDNPNRRKMDFSAGTLALYNDATRDSVLTRFDRYIGPLLVNVFSKLIPLNVTQQRTMNTTSLRRTFTQDRTVCNRLFAANKSFDHSSLRHVYPGLYDLLKAEFQRAHSIFQHDGLAMAANYSVLNYQMPNKEWKKVGEYVNNTLAIADIQWPGGRSKPPPGKPIIYYLKVVTLQEYPFVMMKDPNLDGKCQAGSVICRIGPENSGANHSDPQYYQCCSGFYIDIFNVLKDRLKFEFELYQVLDRTWGGRNPITNKWNGLVAELLENRADLTLTSLKVTTERNAAIDFSIPLMETGIAIVVALRPGAVSTTAFLKPYDYRIWILILVVSLHSVAIVVFIFEYIQQRFTNCDAIQNTENQQSKCKTLVQHVHDLVRSSRKENLNVTFFQSVWLSWVILFRAPAKVNHPKSFTSKFVANIWACFCLAFTASYTANLAAFMITKEIYFDLSGVTDHHLANPHSMKPSFRFGTIANGSTDEVMKTNHKGIYSYMKQFLKRNISQGIKAVKSGELHAFIYDAVVLDYLSGQDDECKLRVVGNWYAMSGYGIGFPKQSKFKEMINKEIIDMHYTGEIERLRRFWFTGACKSGGHQSQRSSQPLETLNFISAFLLLFAGTIIAIIILLCENAYARVASQSKRQSREQVKKQNCMEYEPMLTFDHKVKPTRREKLLEIHIDKLQERIRELEQNSLSEEFRSTTKQYQTKSNELNYTVLPITYSSIAEQSPTLEIVSTPAFGSQDHSTPIHVEKTKTNVYETVV